MLGLAGPPYTRELSHGEALQDQGTQSLHVPRERAMDGTSASPRASTEVVLDPDEKGIATESQCRAVRLPLYSIRLPFTPPIPEKRGGGGNSRADHAAFPTFPPQVLARRGEDKVS